MAVDGGGGAGELAISKQLSRVHSVYVAIYCSMIVPNVFSQPRKPQELSHKTESGVLNRAVLLPWLPGGSSQLPA